MSSTPQDPYGTGDEPDRSSGSTPPPYGSTPPPPPYGSDAPTVTAATRPPRTGRPRPRTARSSAGGSSAYGGTPVRQPAGLRRHRLRDVALPVRLRVPQEQPRGLVARARPARHLRLRPVHRHPGDRRRPQGAPRGGRGPGEQPRHGDRRHRARVDLDDPQPHRPRRGDRPDRHGHRDRVCRPSTRRRSDPCPTRSTRRSTSSATRRSSRSQTRSPTRTARFPAGNRAVRPSGAGGRTPVTSGSRWPSAWRPWPGSRTSA